MFLSMVKYSISEGIAFPQSVTPFFGELGSFEYVDRPKEQGDVGAKNEALKTIEESKLEKIDVPTYFEKSSSAKNEDMLV